MPNNKKNPKTSVLGSKMWTVPPKFSHYEHFHDMCTEQIPTCRYIHMIYGESIKNKYIVKMIQKIVLNLILKRDLYTAGTLLLISFYEIFTA